MDFPVEGKEGWGECFGPTCPTSPSLQSWRTMSPSEISHSSPRFFRKGAMLRVRGSFEILLPGLLLTLLLLVPACAVEEATTQDPPAVAIHIPDTEAGAVLAAALEDARQTHRNVFAHTGADW